MASQAATNFQKVPEGTPKSGLENHSNQGSVSYVSRLCNCEFGFDNDTLPSGKLTVCYGKIHHAINGTIHYFYAHFR